MEKLRMSRHHSTFTLFADLLKAGKSGRWPVLSMDLGRQPVRDFPAELKANLTSEFDEPEVNEVDTGNGTREGHESWKTHGQYPTILPEYLLPSYKRPQHHKPDIIRAVGYTIDERTGLLIMDLTYTGHRTLQIIECKYSTDTNMDTIYDDIKNIYTPLRHSILDHGWWDDTIEIIPIVISRTGSFHVKTLGEIAQLVSWQEEPPPVRTYTSLDRDCKAIVRELNAHAQQWLTLLLAVAAKRLVPSKTPRRHRRHN